MIFDVFHSAGRIDSLPDKLSDRQVFEGVFAQCRLADALDYGTFWLAESHFSSEVQKRHSNPVIPNYQGEVGLNCDSPQLIQLLTARTNRIGFGTAIYNIVGGNGGPIAAADRIRSLAFLNQFATMPRKLDIGFASGRFPFINRPFGIRPRNEAEADNWSQISKNIMCEATEIFLRLVQGQTLNSHQLTTYAMNAAGDPCPARWSFEDLMLVPALSDDDLKRINFVIGSHDPRAQEVALKWADCDIFNLSFTDPEKIDSIHQAMIQRYTNSSATAERRWHRSRMPRTVLVFIDQDRRKAHERANQCIDTYIEAMRGTAAVPDKSILLERALIGDPQEIVEQMSPDNPRRLHPDDRIMLWFEFNQSSSERICDQMKLFAEKVVPAFK